MDLVLLLVVSLVVFYNIYSRHSHACPDRSENRGRLLASFPLLNPQKPTSAIQIHLITNIDSIIAFLRGHRDVFILFTSCLYAQADALLLPKSAEVENNY